MQGDSKFKTQTKSTGGAVLRKNVEKINKWRCLKKEIKERNSLPLQKLILWFIWNFSIRRASGSYKKYGWQNASEPANNLNNTCDETVSFTKYWVYIRRKHRLPAIRAHNFHLYSQFTSTNSFVFVSFFSFVY